MNLCNPGKTPGAFYFYRNQQDTSKIYFKVQRTQNIQNNLLEKEQI